MKNYKNNNSKLVIDEDKINCILAGNSDGNAEKVQAILQKALLLKGLDLEDAAVLMAVKDDEALKEIFATAQKIKEEIYGKRIVIFAPLYISNTCTNDCIYCAFRSSNHDLKRRVLSQNEIAAETELLLKQGHKRILLLAGEKYTKADFQCILDSIATVYKTRVNNDSIRRVNVEIAPLTIEDFKLLKNTSIGTYVLFQETYHRETYEKVHKSGRKADYEWRLFAIDRAMQAGIDDVGIGVLFGLADWRFDVLALLQHVQHLVKEFGIGPHTISVPRLEPAFGTDFASHSPHLVDDLDFCKIIAILRLAVPYTGIIMSTRESIEMRRKTFELGVSQISAGSRTSPGGYSEDEFYASQFALGDHRSLDEVISDVASLDYIPSFCTACYRVGRTGEAFMDLAKPGIIKKMCQPNALLTFQEYLLNYASETTRAIGENLINKNLHSMQPEQKERIVKYLEQIKRGKKDIFV